MPRNLRPGNLNAIYHVTDRGVEQRPIFLTDRDKRVFLAYLRRELRGDGASLFAYCLMTNHFHLLIYVDQVQLDRTMHRALTRYAIYFNRTYKRVGHLFQGRYKSKLVEDYAYLVQVVAYIHENPLDAGLVQHVDEWAWSSHKDWVELKSSLIDFARFEDATGMTSEEFLELYIERIDHRPGPERSNEPSLARLIEDASAAAGISPTELKSGQRGPRISRAKELLFEWTRQRGITDCLVAEALGCTQGSISLFRTRRSNNRGLTPK